jgi:hypothetical protein
LFTDKMGFEHNLPYQYGLGAFLAACLLVFAVKTACPPEPFQPGASAS